jgi:hypothetical protein
VDLLLPHLGFGLGHSHNLYLVPAVEHCRLRNPVSEAVIRFAMEDAFKEPFGPELTVVVEAKVCANWAEK